MKRWLAGAFVLAFACSGGDTPAGGCRFDTDCEGGQLCYATECVPATRFRCGSGRAPVATAEPASLDFGVLDEAPKTLDIVVRNEGDCILQIQQSEVRGDPRFSCEGCSSSELVDVPPDRTASYKVTIEPGLSGTVTGELVFTTDDPEATELVVSLTAMSEGQSLMRVSPLALDFGYVPVGDSKTLVVQAINDTEGTAQLEIVNAYLDPSDGAFSLTTTPSLPTTLVAARVDPAARAALAVTFAPGMDAAHTANLRVVPRNGTPIDVPLVGAELPPVVMSNPGSIDFGSVRIGQQVGARITLQNTGMSPLIASHAFASMGAAGEMTTPRGLPAALAPGSVVELNVLYAPTRAGVASDVITISTNDPVRRTITVPVMGTGEASGQDIVRVDMTFDNDSDSFLDFDLRDVDLILESPVGQIASKAMPGPNWGTYGRPTWAGTAPKENPERIILPDAMEDGRYAVSVSYVEDCKTLPTALTASLLGIGTDALVDYLSDGEVPLDPNQVAAAVSTACAERGSTNVDIAIYVNGAPAGTRSVRLAQKGELVEAAAVVRSNGFFSVE
ncbi:MAG: choice-of-anchor D domain-containing protein [Deltaproteobacteria bacterium]|jgi:hypothetical protein